MTPRKKAAGRNLAASRFSFFYRLSTHCRSSCSEGVAVEHPAFPDRRVRAAGRELLDRLAKAAAAGGREEDDALAGKIIAFQKSIDDGRRHVPPDRIDQQNPVILLDLRIGVRQLRTDGKILHLHRAAGTLVPPVQVSLCVWDSGLDLIQVCLRCRRQFLSDLPGHAAGRKECNQCFTHSENLLWSPPLFRARC